MDRGTVNPDLQRERDRLSFDPLQLSYVLFGGKKKVERRHYIEHMVHQDKEYDTLPYYFKRVEDRYSESVRPSLHMFKMLKQLDFTDPEEHAYYQRCAVDDVHDGSATALHRLAFRPPIAAQGTEEQQNKWLPLIDNQTIIGSYAQTELGHGSNLRAIETTAVYDPTTEQFVLNTPTHSSMKWWPGNLGKSSNHTLLIAQTYTQGKHVGIQAFVVPIRDIESHLPLPGVEVGSIGPTVASTAIDNGFLKLNNVRIPRENMLMKFSKIERDGTYIKPANPRALYQGMLMIRSSIPFENASFMAKAATIVTRYSLVRRQSELKPGDPEPQVLDYQTQQHKVFPAIAMAYAFWFTGKWIKEESFLFDAEIKTGDFSRMASLHSSASALKAYTSQEVAKGVEYCRLACGGHGFSQASGLPSLHGGAVANYTAEGESTVLYLQAARFLIKAVMDAKSGKSLHSLVSYFGENQGLKFQYSGVIDIPSLVKACQYCSVRCSMKAAERVQSLVSQGLALYDASNQSSILLVEASQAHAQALTMAAFAKKISSNELPEDIRKILEPLAAVFGITNVLNSSAVFLENDWMSSNQLVSLRNTLLTIYKMIRPNAIGYADAFDFPDRNLGSVLGSYDGDVYNRLYEWALQAPLNQEEVHSSFHKYVKPLRDEMKSKL